jgi:hypothetical protein
VYVICLHTKSKQQQEVTFHNNLFCLHLVPVKIEMIFVKVFLELALKKLILFKRS